MAEELSATRAADMKRARRALILGAVLMVLGPRALAQQILSAREVHVPKYVYERSEDGRAYVQSGAFLDYFPNGDRLITRAEIRTVQDEEGRWVAQEEARYYREGPEAPRRLLFALPGRRTYGAEDVYGGWSPPGFGALSPSGEWLLGGRLRYWRDAEGHHRADQDVVYNWRSEELLPLPETLDALAWIDEDHLTAVEKADRDPVTGNPRTLLVWDLDTMSVAQRIPLPGSLVRVRFLSPGRLAVQVLPDPTPERPENKPFWDEAWMWYVGRLHPVLGMAICALENEHIMQEIEEHRAKLAAALQAARALPVPASWESGEGLSAFEADPQQVPDKEPGGPLYLVDLTDLENARWELVLDPVTLGVPRISPDGRFAAFAVPRPGFAPGENPLGIYDLQTHRWVRVPEIRGAVRCWLPSGEVVLVNAIRPGAPRGSMDPADWGWFEVDVRPVLGVLSGTSESPNVAGGSK